MLRRSILASPVTDVATFYEDFPYPGPAASGLPFDDVANAIQLLLGGEALQGRSVLDAGCGTGQRLIGLATRFPAAEFTGIDVSKRSLDLAADLLAERKLTNVRLRRQDLHALSGDAERYDIIVCTGVVHHLHEPAIGIADLSRCLAPGGIIYVWLYHSLGEFERLRRRELALMLCPDVKDAATIRAAKQEFGLALEADRYGSRAAFSEEAAATDEAHDMDAFFHPCVNAYRFGELPFLFGTSGLDWIAVNSVNVAGSSFVLDPADAGQEVEKLLAFRIEDHVDHGRLRANYGSLPLAKKLQAIELLLRPTGFGVVGGDREALSRMPARLRAGHLPLAPPRSP